MIFHTYMGTAVDPEPSHIEVEGAPASQHEPGYTAWVSTNGGDWVMAIIVQSRHGKMWKLWGGALIAEVFAQKPIQKPEAL